MAIDRGACAPGLQYRGDTFRARLAPMAVAISLAVSLVVCPRNSARADDFADKSDLFLRAKISSRRSKGRSAVIVRLKGSVTRASEARLVSLGADVYRHLPIVSSLAITIPNRNLKKLAALPFVERISADVTVKKCDEFTVGGSFADTAFQQYGLTGSGVGIAVIDSGVHFTNDLADTVKGGPSRIIGNSKIGQTNTDDFCGHGSHVAGIIAGNGAGSTGTGFFRTFYGIARHTNIINVCVLSNQGSGSVSDVISGIQWLITNQTKYNIRALNLSLGHPVGESYTTDPLCQAVESAWKAGIAVVCAAGNAGRLNSAQTSGLDNEEWGTAYGSIQSPANDPYVITVGAMKNIAGGRSNDRIATYSSRGPTRLDLVLKPDIVAPGNQVISLNTNNSWLAKTYGSSNLIPVSSYKNGSPQGCSTLYFRLSGTSMAAPVVSGAIALMLEANPTLTPDTIKARLMISADKWIQPDGSADPSTFGAGYLNIMSALNCTVTVPSGTFAVSPPLYRDANGNVFLDRALWGTHAIWGSGVSNLNAVWVANAISGTNAVWGSTALWGSSALWGTNAVWGARAIWGSTVWTNNAVWGSSTNAVDLSDVVIGGE